MAENDKKTAEGAVKTVEAVPPKVTTEEHRLPDRRRVMVFTILLVAIVVAIVLYAVRLNSPYRSTEDAYVHGNQIFLTPRVSGTVVSIKADDTDLVVKGQALVVLDDSDAKVKLQEAEGTLGDTMRKVCQFFVTVRQLKANVEARKIDLLKAEDDFRRRTVARNGTVSSEDITHSHQSADAARETLNVAEQQLAAARAMVASIDLEHHPLVLQAEANVLDADLDLQRTTISAPETGYVVRRNVQVGQRVTPGTPLLAIVPLNQIWVDANFKEHELKRVRIGQSVLLTSDFYGSATEFKGRVVGLSPSTGAAFSLLPPDEGSGNWIKIVQRVPVRIALDEKQLEKFPLRIGISMRTEIDTQDQSGQEITKSPSNQTVYSTSIYSDDWNAANNLLKGLVATNLQALSNLAQDSVMAQTKAGNQREGGHE
jgi:membrane fusion protein (multidrug efflux system)